MWRPYLIACQMTMDLFEYDAKDMIPGIKIGGAATYMEPQESPHF